MKSARPASRSVSPVLTGLTGLDPLVRFYIISGSILLIAGLVGYLHDFLIALIVSAIAVIAGTIAYIGFNEASDRTVDAERWAFLRQSLIREPVTSKRQVAQMRIRNIGRSAILNPEFRFEYVPQHHGEQQFAVIYLHGALDADRWIQFTEPLIDATARQRHSNSSNVLLFDIGGLRSINEESVGLFYNVQEKAPDFGVSVGFVSSSRRNQSVMAQIRHSGLRIYGSIGSALAGISEAQA